MKFEIQGHRGKNLVLLMLVTMLHTEDLALMVFGISSTIHVCNVYHVMKFSTTSLEPIFFFIFVAIIGRSIGTTCHTTETINVTDENMFCLDCCSVRVLLQSVPMPSR